MREDAPTPCWNDESTLGRVHLAYHDCSLWSWHQRNEDGSYCAYRPSGA